MMDKKIEKSNPKDDQIIKIFGDNVRAIRKQKGLSQEDLATICDIDVMSISRIERNISNSTISTLSIIARALNVDPDILLKKDNTTI